MNNHPLEQHGMTKERYQELSDSFDLHLTKEEVANGWFFSDEFDGLLVHKSWPEAQFD